MHSSGGGYLARVSGAIAAVIPAKPSADLQLLKALTKPLTKLIIEIDESAVISSEANHTLGKIYCHNEATKCRYVFRPMIEQVGDHTVGVILLVGSLITLTGILVVMVKLLKSLIIGVIDDALKKILHVRSHGWKEYLLGYVFILIGMVGAILVQSSSKYCVSQRSSRRSMSSKSRLHATRIYSSVVEDRPLSLHGSPGPRSRRLLLNSHPIGRP